MVKITYIQYLFYLHIQEKKPTQTFHFLRKETAYGADRSHRQLFSTYKQTEENQHRLQMLIMGVKG